MAGTLHLSVINNQYEDTVIHMVGEGYEDDITLDNIHGWWLPPARSPQDISLRPMRKAAEDLVAGESEQHQVLATVGPWVIFIILFFKIFF